MQKMKNIIKLGKLEIDLEEFRDFIVDAKKSCYAGKGKEIILPDGSKLLTFQKGNFYYEDNYAYYYQAPGRELAKWKNENGQRIWQMAYSGGMLNKDGMADINNKDEKLTKETFSFLKEALSNVPREIPFRGPRFFERGRFKYYHHDIISYAENNLIRAKGGEQIDVKGRRNVFSQDWVAEVIIPK